MKKIIDKQTVIFSGIVAIGVVLAVLAISIYFGMRAGASFTEAMSILFLKAEIHMGFFMASIIPIALFCLKTSSNKIFKQMFVPVLICIVSMLLVNIWLIPRNFIAIFVALFWAFSMIYLYQTRRELNAIGNTFNKHIETDRE